MKKQYFLLLIAGLMFSLSACDKDDKPSSDNPYVNEWIYNQMSANYLWNTEIASKKPNYSASPSDFFESILYKRGAVDGDRFSWIQENYVELLNSLSGRSSYDVGFEYVGYLEATGSDNIIGEIAYVKPNTPAMSMGLKRGDRFKKVNGVQLIKTNWRSMFNSGGNVTIAFIDPVSKAEVSKVVGMVTSYAEKPVYLDSVYNVGTKKVGYLVYNFFAADDGSGNAAYDIKLNEVFGKFKAAGITHLVLDLRYNSGGSMNSATLLGSMVVPQLNTNNVFTKVQYNSDVEAYFKQKYGNDVLLDKFRDKVEVNASTSYPLNNVGSGLQSLYVLTGDWTASASELVINNLKPYMSSSIVLIGKTTVGKNVGSVSIYEENDARNKWGMQPIVLKYFNKDGQADFLNGFTPNVAEPDNGANKLPLGNRNEVMLSIALSMVNGTYSPTSVKRQSSERLLQPVGASVEQKAWANQAIANPNLFKK